MEVEAKSKVVRVDEEAATTKADEAQALKNECESDLAEAIPALEAALSALDTLKPSDVTIVKSMKNPPSGVKLVMSAVCVMKGIKPDKMANPAGTGKKVSLKEKYILQIKHVGLLPLNLQEHPHVSFMS